LGYLRSIDFILRPLIDAASGIVKPLSINLDIDPIKEPHWINSGSSGYISYEVVK